MKCSRSYPASRLSKFLLISFPALPEPRGLRMMAKSRVTKLLKRDSGYLLCICHISTVSPHTLSIQGDPAREDAREERKRISTIVILLPWSAIPNTGRGSKLRLVRSKVRTRIQIWGLGDPVGLWGFHYKY